MLKVVLLALLASVIVQPGCAIIRGVWYSRMKYYILDPPNMVGMYNKVVEDNSCFDYARMLPEPYTERYMPRSSFSLPYPWTVVPRSYWRWDGPKFGREAFLATRDDRPGGRCSGCDMAVHFKVIGGRLWKEAGCEEACDGRVRAAEELLTVTLHLFPLPDMEFLLHMGDGCGFGRPTINYSYCRNVSEGGFTMPSYGVWMSSMGPTQMAAYHACLWERYPPSGRLPMAVWRGATTNFEPVTEENYQRAPRLRLHMLARQHPRWLDARLTRITPKLEESVQRLFNDTGPGMPTEDYNRYCVVLDLDGNGWSDRFGQYLIHFPTPILKLASNITAFFEHFFPPGADSDTTTPDTTTGWGGGTLEQFSPDMSDLVERVRDLVAECRGRGPRGRGFRSADAMQRTARATMDHVGIAEAMAHSLMTYRDTTGFPMDYSLGGFKEVNGSCCHYTNIPEGMAQAIEAQWQAARGSPARAGSQ